MDDDHETLEFLRSLGGLEGLSEQDISEIGTLLREPSEIAAPKAVSGIALKEHLSESEIGDLRTQISRANLTEKVKLAMFGNQTCRLLLINDPNKTIQMSVLKNPKLRANEVEDFTKSKNMSDLVLRTISENKSWMKSYAIKENLVFNPKTPGDIGLKWLRYLNPPELKQASKSRDVPQLISVTAKKRLAEIQKKG